MRRTLINNNNVRVHVNITTTTMAGLLVILIGFVSLFIIRDPHFASTCIISGSGLMGCSKVCNDFGNNNNQRRERTVQFITREEYFRLPTSELTRKDIEWRIRD